jgi:TRAP-type transport system small permease protein
MLHSLNNALERILLIGFALLFGALIIDVFFQVIARNALRISVPWTLDLAQLLVSWCIFLGAGLATRRSAHYFILLFPDSFRISVCLLKLLSNAVITIIALVMTIYGLQFAQMGLGIESRSLALSAFWNYLPIQLSGMLMLIFVAEHWISDSRVLSQAIRER